VTQADSLINFQNGADCAQRHFGIQSHFTPAVSIGYCSCYICCGYSHKKYSGWLEKKDFTCSEMLWS